MYNVCRLERLPNATGMVPVSWLFLRYKNASLERLPSSGGMVPISWLSWRYNSVRFVRLLSAGGIMPVSRLFPRDNLVTRLLETVTPSHWFMGVVILQFSEALPANVSLAPRSTAQSATRLGSSGSGTAMLLEQIVDCAAMGAPATRKRPASATAVHRRADRTPLGLDGVTSAMF